MSLKCANCGTVQPSGKFCPSCGGQMLPMDQTAPAPPPQPQQYVPPQQPPYPQHVYQPQAPKAGGGKGWMLWAGIGGGVIVVGAILAFVLLGGDKPAPTKPLTDPPKAADTKTPAGKSIGSTALKVLSQGSFGAQPKSTVAHGSFIGTAFDNGAAIYQVDAKGQLKLMNRLDMKQSAGEFRSLAVGDLNNDGNIQMLALYEKTLFIVPGVAGAQVKEVNAAGLENVMVGDYDGDGKTETILFGLDAQGKYSFQVWRYPGDSWIYKKEGRQDPWPTLFPTEIKSGKKTLMLGYEFVGDAFNLILYQWDGVGGPAVFGRYPVENKADAPPEYIAAGTTGLGASLVVARGGAKPTIEVLTVAQDGKSAKSVGRFEPGGTGIPGGLPGKFTGQNSQLMSIDEAGNYTLYDLGK